MIHKQVIIIGGGPAGLAAALQLSKQGVTDLLIIEREKFLGGILRQCIHDGFGLTRFGETLSGPEYAQRFIDEVTDAKIEYITDATVINITGDKEVAAVSRKGLLTYKAKAIVLAMGCRERTRGAISLPGSRPAGVYTAGVAQSYINLQNIMPGKNVIILGSGDIGMIMARRFTLEGAHVQAMFEIAPYPNGLPRNMEQCLNDYHIPLFLSHTIVNIKGTSRVEGITVAQVDDKLQPIAGTEKDYECDTLILSVGLIPENELSIGAGVEIDPRTKGPVVDENYQTGVDGIFAAGNVLQVHDLVDFVSIEAQNLADSVADYLEHKNPVISNIQICPDSSISHTIPQKVSGKSDFKLSFRVRKPMKNCQIEVRQNSNLIGSISLKKALPAEMIQMKVKSENIEEIGNLEVVVVC